MGTAEVAVIQPSAGELASFDFMPVFEIGKAVQRRNMLVKFTQELMIKDVDFGTPGGISGKPSLLKAGAEKLITFFGLTPEFITIEQTEDWTGDSHRGEAFFYYRYKCRLTRNGRPIGEGEGSCNTWESKYRYRWVREDYVTANGFAKDQLVKRGGKISEFTFAVDKAETTGRYGKPAAYWQAFKDAIENGSAKAIKKPMGKDQKLSDAWEIESTEYRVPNPDVADQVNTCQKMAQKRALVAAVLIAVNASEFFTQDIEDLEQIEYSSPVSTGGHPINTQAAADHVAEEKLKGMREQQVPPMDIKAVLAHIKNAKEELAGEFGESGEARFHNVLAQFGVKSPKDIKGLAQARQILNGLADAKRDLQTNGVDVLDAEFSDANENYVEAEAAHS